MAKSVDSYNNYVITKNLEGVSICFSSQQDYDALIYYYDNTFTS